MYRRVLTGITVLAASAAAAAVPVSAGAAVSAGTAGTASVPPPVVSSQNPDAGPAYTGHPARPRPLPPNARYVPVVSDMHGEGGNTNTSPYAGPTGSSPVTGSAQGALSPQLWDAAGHLTSGYVNTSSGTPVYAVAALDPATLAVTAEWDAPAGAVLNLGYMYQNARDQVLVSSRQGQVYVIQRGDGSGGPSFSLIRDVDLAADGVLPPGQSLFNAAFDSAGNIWFTTGGVLGIGQDAGTSATIGYITPAGAVHAMTVPGQAVENGIAVSGTTAYVVTGPVETDTANATGTMYALAPAAPGASGGSGVRTVWSQPYQAGDEVKPGGFARGSGSTPTLLGNRYVAITDNANNQVSLLVYRQGAARGGERQLVCRTPLFSPGASANDIGLVGDDADGQDSVVALNDYDAPAYTVPTAATINGTFNDMNQMAPGVEKLTVPDQREADDGGACPVQWNKSLRIKSVPVLSTKTGLLYGYTQDSQLAAGDTYVWYFTALDYRTGKVVWQVRAGAGGTYNDAYKAASIGPDGTLYQGVQDGVVTLKDGG